MVASCGGDQKAPTLRLSAAAAHGEQLVGDKGCATCHTTDGGRSTGPTWKGLAGSKVKLEGGRDQVADSAYLHRSITEPKADTVAGFANIMPSYSGLTPAQVDDIVAYIQALSTNG